MKFNPWKLYCDYTKTIFYWSTAIIMMVLKITGFLLVLPIFIVVFLVLLVIEAFKPKKKQQEEQV